MFSKGWFWTAFIVVGVLCGVFIYFYGATAFSFINVKTTMDRAGSLQAADSLQKALGHIYPGYRKSTVFTVDWSFQNYVELKAGGKKAFEKVLKEQVYFPYYWEIRCFKEGKPQEVTYFFTPTGKPYGFREKLAETDKGAALSSKQAQAIAESVAVRQWHLDLTTYGLIETSQNERPSKRIDHTFVYELKNRKEGEALYRIRCVVSGDRLTTFEHFTKIPDAFFKEYEQMRSANNTITSVGSGVMAVLYLLGGLIFLFIFLRKRFLIWKQPLIWAGIIGLVQILSELNSFSFYWWGYDTSLSISSFLTSQLLMMIVGTVADAVIVFVSLMLAEALSRQAFPSHMQLWKLWEKDTAPSTRAMGQTLGGYLMVPIFLAYVVLFYAVTVNKLGWWQPASTLSDPNILGSYFVWFSPLAAALHAGFWEEALFRAVPLAAMAIIGTKLGKRKLFIGIGMVLQALVFGSLHASYSTQPAYARMVELIVPALMFGFIYLRFGLLTGILMHFSYDAVLMNMGAFFTQVPGIWLDRSIFILLLFIPVWIILWRRLKARQWVEVPVSSLNQAWHIVPEAEIQAEEEAEAAEEAAEEAEAEAEAEAVKETVRKPVSVMLVTVLIVLAMLFSLFRFGGAHLKQHLRLTPRQAEQIARQAIKDTYKTDIPKDMRAYAHPKTEWQATKLFILEKEGVAVFNKLNGKYLLNDGWEVRFMRFKGSLEARTERYWVALDNKGKVYNITHNIAEGIAGKTIAQDSARAIVLSHLRQKDGWEQAQLKEISSVPQKLPKRQDWVFEYQDTLTHALKDGQARISVRLIGDTFASINHYIHIPEPWKRAYDNNTTKVSSVKIVVGLLLFLFILLAIIQGIIRWARRQFNLGVFIRVALISAAALLITSLLDLRNDIGDFYPIEPFRNQMLTWIIGAVLKLLFFSAFLGLINGMTAYWHSQRHTYHHTDRKNLWLFLPVAALLLVIQSPVGRGFNLVLNLNSPSLAAANVFARGLYIACKALITYYLVYGLLQYFFYLISHLTHHNTKAPWLKSIILLMGFALSFLIFYEYTGAVFVWYSLVMGAIFSLLLWLLYNLLHNKPELTWLHASLIISSLMFIPGILQHAYYHALLANLSAGVFFVLFILLSHKEVQAPAAIETQPETGAAASTTSGESDKGEG